VRKLSIAIIEDILTFFQSNVRFSWNSISGSADHSNPADHCTPSDLSQPSCGHYPIRPSTHTPQTAHLGPPEVAVSSATSLTTLYAPTTHPPTPTMTPPLPEFKRSCPKWSVKVKLVTYGPRVRLGRPPGTDYKQRLKASLGEDAAQAAKRPRGRPRQQASSPVSVEFGK
jgi:hypothetical protein